MELSSLLANKGHQTGIFSVEHPKNNKTSWSEFFPPNINLNNNNLFNAIRSVYSIKARKNISRLLDSHKFDLAHLHNIYHHLTPSIIPELKKRKIPIVMTVGDYHLISPNYFMFHNGSICEKVKPDKYYKAVFHKCVKGSYLKSLLEVMEKYFYHFLKWEREYIDMFIAPSNFMKSKLLEYGIPEKKVITLPYFVDSGQYKPDYNPGKYILYFGRLSEEKGLMVLLRAMKLLPEIKLVIAGVGPQENELRIEKKESRIENVEFAGYKSGKELTSLIQNCRFTVLPSVWNEVFGLSILESFACGKPVIAARIGGIPEVIDNEKNGLLVKANNPSELVNAIRKLWNNFDQCKKIGEQARNDAVKKFNPDNHLRAMLSIYKSTRRLKGL